MSDIFQEVHDEVRQDKYHELWRAYGKYAIALAVALVLGTAGWQAWKSYAVVQREAESVEFFSAMELLTEGQHGLAADAFSKLGEKTSSGYGALARFRQAEALIATGNADAAVEIYDQLAADSSVDKRMRDLAALYATMQLMEIASADELKSRLGLLIDDDNPWRFTARELYAVVAYKAGDLDVARDTFSGLANDPNAPSPLKARAAEMLAVVGVAVE
ncbi:MAG: tetratricopeptide repeat protein [Sphingomonadales bacterium]